MKKGILICLSGFSGAGKGTIVKKLMEKYPNYALSISATTRDPRDKEKEGVSYFFKTREEFEKMISDGELLEYAEYAHNYYGTPKKYVYEMLEQGKDVILEIEVQGSFKVKARYPDTLLVFVVAPTVEEVRNRLKIRATESPEVIEERMAQIDREVKCIPEYDYLLVNDDLEESVEILNSIIRCEHLKTYRNTETVKRLEIESEGK